MPCTSSRSVWYRYQNSALHRYDGDRDRNVCLALAPDQFGTGTRILHCNRYDGDRDRNVCLALAPDQFGTGTRILHCTGITVTETETCALH